METKVWKLTDIGLLLAILLFVPSVVLAQRGNRNTVKVPCRDMGDGRTLIDSLYLPDWYVDGKSKYRIIATKPTSMADEWANKVCTIEIKQ